MATNREMDDLKKEAPLLFSIEKRKGQELPDGYFESFPDRLMKKIRQNQGDSEEQQESGGFSSHRLAAAIAVLMMLGFGAVFYLNRDSLPVLKRADFSSLSREEILSGIEISMLDESSLIAMIDDKELENALAGDGGFSPEMKLLNESSEIVENEQSPKILDESDFDHIDINVIDPELLNKLLEE